MWGFSTIKNQYQGEVLIDYVVPAESTQTGSEMNGNRGNAIVEVAALGAITLTDVGHEADQTYWGVRVEWTNGPSGIYWLYSGAGQMGITVNPDGSFLITGGRQDISGNFNG